MNATTVKLQRHTKAILDKLKGERESYDEVISRLAEQTRKKELKNEMIEGYERAGREELQSLKEWETASNGI